MPSRNILIISGENKSADLCRVTLDGLGHNVSCVPTGEQAVELVRESPLDLVLIDYSLAGINGIAAFKAIRTIEPNLSGLLMTDKADLPLVIDAMNKGLSRVLEKPLNPEDVVSAVQHALATAQLREENTRLKTLIPLYQLGERFMAATSAEEVYDELVSIIASEIHPHAVSVMMPDPQSGLLKIVASQGVDEKIRSSIAIKPGEKIAGWVYKNGKPVILNRQTQHESQFSSVLNRDEIAAAISFPLAGREKVLGVVNISQTNTSIEYSQADIEMLSVVCRQAVLALENVAYMHDRVNTARMKTLFEQYVAPEVAEVLLKYRKNLLDVGEINELTVLFADIRNFTALVQHIDPGEMRLFLNQFFDSFTDIIFSCQGTLDKYMGDAALVIFGAPVPTANPTFSAIEAARKVVASFEQLQKKWIKKHAWFEQVGIGIGISRGEMFLGNIGSSKRFDYTVIGTDVNVTQRLASDTIPGQVLFTQAVYDIVAGTVPTSYEGMRLLRGMDKAIPIYSLRLAGKEKGHNGS